MEFIPHMGNGRPENGIGNIRRAVAETASELLVKLSEESGND